MNTPERKVGDLLRAYGEGLEMTTQDINRLEQELEQKQAKEHGERQEARARRRGRIFQGAVAACAVTGVVLAVLALRGDPVPPNVPADAPALTRADLAGIWSYDSWLWTFHTDGTLTQTQAPYDPDTHYSGEASAFGPAPGGFVEHQGTGATACDITWAATILPEGRLRATPTKESGAGCEPSSPVDPGAPSETLEFTRVSPVSVAGANLALLWPTVAPKPVRNLASVHGTWLLRGTDTILSIDDAGLYAVRTFGALYQPEIGRASVPGAGSLVFTPRDHPACAARYETVTSRNSTMDAKVATGSCKWLGSATTDTWIRIN